MQREIAKPICIKHPALVYGPLKVDLELSLDQTADPINFVLEMRDNADTDGVSQFGECAVTCLIAAYLAIKTLSSF